jgi:hypothetical protein
MNAVEPKRLLYLLPKTVGHHVCDTIDLQHQPRRYGLCSGPWRSAFVHNRDRASLGYGR